MVRRVAMWVQFPLVGRGVVALLGGFKSHTEKSALVSKLPLLKEKEKWANT